jgi:hypothetical protein
VAQRVVAVRENLTNHPPEDDREDA